MRTEPRKLETEPLNRKIMVHGAMYYQCESCLNTYLMWLERGIEDPYNREKPAPFCIQCLCGRIAQHVSWEHDIKLGDYKELGDKSNYFGNEENSDCGVSHIRNDGDFPASVNHPDVSDLIGVLYGQYKDEESFLSQYAVEKEEDDSYGLAQFSTSTLKAELRRRKRWK